MKRHWRGLTLLELLIALCLFSLVVIAVASMEVYARNQTVVMQRRVKLQNDLSVLFAYLAKGAGAAVGNGSGGGLAALPGKIAVKTPQVNPKAYDSLQFYADANQNGRWDVFPNDFWIAFVWTGVAGPLAERRMVRFYPNIPPQPVINEGNPYEIIAYGITNFVVQVRPTNAAGNTINYVQVTATACWNVSTPALALTCGSSDNPSLTMSTTLNMPQVPTN